MLERTIKRIKNLCEYGNQFNAEEILNAVRYNVAVRAETYARKTLYAEAELAVQQVDELNYEPLKSHLLQNLLDWRHYMVDPNSLSFVILFNTNIGGTFEDLQRGQQAAWTTTTGTPTGRAWAWKYGIYKPEREGASLSPLTGEDSGKDKSSYLESLPSYSEIISRRIDFWGEKAPYWYILEWGNVGSSLAYPNFSGTNFVERVKSRGPEFIRAALEVEIPIWLEGIADATDDMLDNPERVKRITVVRVSLGEIEGTKYAYETRRTTTGKICYMLIVGGRYAAGISLGQPLPTGAVFNP